MHAGMKQKGFHQRNQKDPEEFRGNLIWGKELKKFEDESNLRFHFLSYFCRMIRCALFFEE
jgi:hypothetical protein